jgi:hypothetical protein
MKKLFFVLSACLLIVLPTQAQCDLEFDFVNTGSNMTAFFTPPAAAAIYSDLGDGQVGAFYINEDGSYVCGSSATFTGNQLQLAVMGDDATTPSKDGFSSGEVINWFYKSNDGAVHSLDLNPADNFVINAMTFIGSAVYSEVDCGGTTTDDECPALETEFLNTGSNMTLFLTPNAASALSAIGNGVIAVYYDSSGVQVCAGSTSFSGASAQIAANGDDATTTEKDGFSAGESIVWKFEDESGNQYDLNPTPSDNFSLNGISYVSGFTFSLISCSVDVDGCTDAMYLEFDESATIDDGSCLTIAIPGCTNQDYIEYNSLANLDDGSCATLILEGCMDEAYIEYNANATVSDGSCLTLALYGCTDEAYLEFNSEANVNDGSCTTLIVNGCTDSNYIEYNSNANTNDASCNTLIVLGCTDVNAENYNSSANTNDGSCEYDLIGAGCEVSFETLNTGSNHTIMIPASLSNTLNIGDQIGVFFLGENGTAICAGSSTWTGQVMQIVAFGDDTTTDEVDGLVSGAPFLFLAQSGDDVYVVNATFQSSTMANYAVNGLSFVSDFELELACSVEHFGCIDVNACNFDASANTDNGSCEYAQENLDCSGVCLNDSDNDGICNENEIVGCMDASASNFNSEATDADNSCVSWEDAYGSCVESGGDDGITQADVDVVQVLLNAANLSLANAENNILSLESELNAALANQEDGVTQADVDAIQNQLDAANANISSLNDIITYLESDISALSLEISESNATIAILEAQIEEILANCGDDGITQVDVDAVQELLDEANISITDLQSELAYALANQEDGIGQAELDEQAAISFDYGFGEGFAAADDGIGQADVDAAYTAGAASVTPEDGVTQADVDAIQVLLDEALANTGGGSCEAIYVDLLSGWNIIGYTLTFNQDVAATLDPIVDNVQIVKNNAANVYWPEYGFNGIGDFIPGQGYQIRMYNEVSSYTFPDVDGLRINLTATVPAYVYDLPVLNHPNDIKSLVRVVNMLGQEVDPDNQFNGEVLLYLFNDGTTEKIIVE